MKTLYFLAIMLTAIAMGAALAHLFELPNKIDLSAADYLTVQRNYDNWSIVGLRACCGNLFDPHAPYGVATYTLNHTDLRHPGVTQCPRATCQNFLFVLSPSARC